MSGPLSGLRVVDLGEGPVTGLATMVLADFGADVLKVEPPGGDPHRGQPSAPMWLRGKSSLTVDLEDAGQVERLRAVVTETAHAVVTTLPRDRREALGLDYRSLSERRPDLVYGAVSGFGEDGPYSDYPAVEAVVAAKFGRMASLEGIAPRRGPCYAALQVATHATSQSVASGLLASLHRRVTTGQGAEFDTSLMRGLLPYDIGGLQVAHLRERGVLPTPSVPTDPTTTLPRIYYHGARTRDGRWIQFGNLLPHLQDNWFAASGIERPEGGVPPEGSPELEAFRDRMLEHIASRDLDEWMDVFVGHGGVVAHQYQTTQEALHDPDVVANGHAVQVNGGIQLGPVADLTRTPAAIGTDCREIDFAEALRAPAPSRASAAQRSRGGRPLEGLTVVEAATIIAAPLGAATLADLGARVIKFEPPGGDPFRAMMHGTGAARCNTGKESICLDLKAPDAREVARRLVARADLFIHNYRPGVPERLGIGYEALREDNPGLIYLSANGYGRNGPGAKRPSTHPIPGAALGGVVWQMGGLPEDGPLELDAVREVARALFRANEVNPDPNTSMVIATAATLGLLARDLTGRGQEIFVDMFGANAYGNWDDFLSYPGKAGRPRVDSDIRGLGPRCRLYECREGWVFLYVRNDDEWARLDAPDETALEARFRTDDAQAWEARLTAEGIACVRADAAWPAQFLLHDPHAQAEELVVTAPHAEWGEYLRHGPMVRFDRDGRYGGACVPGEHTVRLLEELGYATAAIDGLLGAGAAVQFSP